MLCSTSCGEKEYLSHPWVLPLANKSAGLELDQLDLSQMKSNKPVYDSCIWLVNWFIYNQGHSRQSELVAVDDLIASRLRRLAHGESCDNCLFILPRRMHTVAHGFGWSTLPLGLLWPPRVMAVNGVFSGTWVKDEWAGNRESLVCLNLW